MNKNLSKVILASLLGGSLLGNALYVNTALAADKNDQILIVDGTETTNQIAGDATGAGNANNNTLIIAPSLMLRTKIVYFPLCGN